MHTPWVLSVEHLGGLYFVLDPLWPAMCSTWYLVRRSLKSESVRKRSRTFSVVMPMFTRNVVRVKRPMWERWWPLDMEL